jgi:hypothetical protein
MPRYLAIGTRCMTQFVGYSTTRMAMYIHVVSQEYYLSLAESNHNSGVIAIPAGLQGEHPA